MNEAVPSDEAILRLLFSNRMTSDDGTLTKEAFPVDELSEKSGKSVSVDRMKLVTRACIKEKLEKLENPNKARKKWGVCSANVDAVVKIRSQCDVQVFAVYVDALSNCPANCWDAAHAKIVRADQNFTKGFLRGYRDMLVEVFQKDVIPFF